MINTYRILSYIICIPFIVMSGFSHGNTNLVFQDEVAGFQNNKSKIQQNKKLTSKKSNDFGFAEVFIRFPEGGTFTVKLGDQSIENSNGKFRFYDLHTGSQSVSIIQKSNVVYKTSINIEKDKRMVFDYFQSKGLYFLESYPITHETYGFNQWEDVWNNFYNQNTPMPPISTKENSSIMNEGSFNHFIESIRQENFDKGKVALIEQQLEYNQFNTNQIITMLEQLSFEGEKLKIAQKLYPHCTNPEEFYKVYDVFSLESNKRKLQKAVKNMNKK